jgi:hypothetical protein
MSLYPGAPRLINPDDPPGEHRYVLDDTALEESMAKIIEEEMTNVFGLVKGTPLPDSGKEDRRLLYVAISRGVLKCLRDHQVSMSTTVATNGGPPRTGRIDLNVTMNSHLPHLTLQLSPQQVAPGQRADGTIELSYPAPPGDADVRLSSDNVAVAAPDPTSITIPEGQRFARFKVETASRSTPVDVTVNVAASVAGAEQTTSLSVLQS